MTIVKPFGLLVVFISCILLLRTAQCQPQSISEDPRCQKDDDFTCDASQQPVFKEEDRIAVEHATRTLTGVRFTNTFVDFSVRFDISGAEVKLPYRLIACGCPIPPNTQENRTVIFTNPTNVFVQDGPTLAMVLELYGDDEPLPVKYVNTLQFIYSDRIRALGSANPPAVFDMTIDLLQQNDDMGIGLISTSTWTYPGTVTEFEANYSRPLLTIGEVSETNPLARAEWVKLLGLVFSRGETGNKVFRDIEDDYEDAKKKALQASRRPSVFFNYPFYNSFYEGTDLDRYGWTQPGNKQYIAAFVSDANGDYRYNFKGLQNMGNNFGMTQAVKEFRSARILINADPFDFGFGYRNLTIADITKSSPSDSQNGTDFVEAMRSLDAVRCGSVWGRRKRVNGDALDFFESGVAKPNLILKDLIKILHPDVNLGGYQITYMSQYVLKPSDNLECPYTNLIGQPDSGEAYVNTKLKIEGLDRYEVQDQLEANVFPELEERGISKEDVDVQFREPSIAREELVNCVVRVRVSEEDAASAAESSDVLDAFKSGLQPVDSAVSVFDVTRNLTSPMPSPAGPTELVTPSPSQSPGQSPADTPAESPAVSPLATPSEASDSDDPPSPAASTGASPTPESSGSSSSLSSGAIAGIAVGAILVLLAVIAIALYMRSRRTPQTYDPFPGST